ncbi:hypothetical protein GGR56DRAFT_652844 [Xylariaceae sp. FL0804]|nr:hypothetical protein GGR56DRAFT_652844 [Xylariaceae sp. FL0804]
MANPPDPMGEDNWLAYLDEQRRQATDFNAREKVVGEFQKAISLEPGSLRLWLAYCEWFWSLFTECQASDAGWSDEEQIRRRSTFSFDSALILWSEGYEHIKYRINDSHEFWDRWVSIELEQLDRTRTPSGVKRISHLFRDRLQVPHAAWDSTSQLFSSFLGTYNNAAYESEFQEVTAKAQGAKRAYQLRESYELDLRKAAASADHDEAKAKMKKYLDWEMVQWRHGEDRELRVSLCLGLYSRALTGIFAFDDEVWTNFAVYLSTLHHHAQSTQSYHPLPSMKDFFQRATEHCPWSGPLWSRYILTAEESGSSFEEIQAIKHAATSRKSLDKNGMTGVLDMYTAWCGFLKRTAMAPNAPADADHAADVAQVGLVAALEDVELWGKRLYGEAYQGDPNYRLERILIQYLTEVKGDLDEARRHWNRMAGQPLFANSYDFWLNYYLWEMMVFASRPRPRSPTPATAAGITRTQQVPAVATSVLMRAVARKTLDWPERVMDVYLQHCNDYEQPDTLHSALDAVYKARRGVAKRRERESAEAAAAYAAQVQPVQEQSLAVSAEDALPPQSPSGSKRKREGTPDDTTKDLPSKKAKNHESNGLDATEDEQQLKRDRENTSVMVTGLPADSTATAVKKYFKEYGHINNIIHQQEADHGSSSALIEFRSTEDALSALLRDNKYFGQSQISVKPGTGLTLFVTNYPPTADDEYLRNLYKDCGDIFSIRWPSLRFNTHRRFCYISFRDRAAAHKATQKHGKVLDGQYKLTSQYSNPGHRKGREGAVAEGREVRVTNVHPNANEIELRSIFARYGKVASVRILTNMGGESIGTAFIAFETKEDAQKALDLDKTKYKSRIIEVEVSKETNFKPFATARGNRGSASNSASPAPPGDGDDAMQDARGRSHHGPTPAEIQERTMAIMNVPDTVNDARVRALVENHGTVAKLVLRPDHQGAIVEFAEASTARRAALALAGTEIAPGHKLRTGTVKELFREKANNKSRENDDKAGGGGGSSKNAPAAGGRGGRGGGLMAPPPSVRRPQALGSRGGRRGGLGLSAPRKLLKENEAHSQANKANGTEEAAKGGPSKSNADFKAMFLGGNSGGGGGGTGSDGGHGGGE